MHAGVIARRHPFLDRHNGVLVAPASNKSIMPTDVPDFSAIVSGDQFRSARSMIWLHKNN
jgi:hypothetical protein